MSEPEPISGKRIWLKFYIVRSDVDTVDHRYCSRGFGAVEIGGIHEPGMRPYLLCVGRKCPPSIGLCPPPTALWSLNQSAISQRGWGFLTARGDVDPRKLGWLPRVDGSCSNVERTLDPG